MFERFTDRSRRAIVLAQEEARLLSHNYIGSEGHEAQKGHIPFTPRAKKVLELSLREALTLRSQSISSEHLLLGLVAEGEGVGAQILERLGASFTAVRERAIELAGNEPDPAPTLGEAAVASSLRRVRLEGLGGVLQQTLTSIDRRLARIEQHLGITADPEEAAPAAGEPAAEPAAEAGGDVAPEEPSGDEPAASE